jgi:hypothetical protein
MSDCPDTPEVVVLVVVLPPLTPDPRWPDPLGDLARYRQAVADVRPVHPAELDHRTIMWLVERGLAQAGATRVGGGIE